jgi:hypothetical protein
VGHDAGVSYIQDTGRSPMDKTYIVLYKAPETKQELVVAATAEVTDGYLMLRKDSGELAEMFAMDNVEGWGEIASDGSVP